MFLSLDLWKAPGGFLISLELCKCSLSPRKVETCPVIQHSMPPSLRTWNTSRRHQLIPMWKGEPNSSPRPWKQSLLCAFVISSLTCLTFVASSVFSFSEMSSSYHALYLFWGRLSQKPLFFLSDLLWEEDFTLSWVAYSNGSFMFQGIILSGDASGLTPVEITHTNGVGPR